MILTAGTTKQSRLVKKLASYTMLINILMGSWVRLYGDRIRVFSALRDKSKVRLAKSSYVGKDRDEICTADAKPGCESSTVLIHSCGWYPSSACAASLIGVVRTIGGQCREHGPVGTGYAIKVTASDRTAHNKMVRAPGVVCPQIAIRYEGACEI